MTSYANSNESPISNTTNTTTAATTTTNTIDVIDLTETSPGSLNNTAGLTNNFTQQQQQLHSTPPLLSTNNVILNKKLPALPLEDFYIDSSHLMNNSNGSYSSPNTTLASSSENYDCDSLSDGHEKADTTPENIKKIDDIMDEEKQQKPQHPHYQYQQQQQQQQQQNMPLSSSRYNTTNAQHTIEPSLVGLAAAIDDSNAKYLYATNKSPTHHHHHHHHHYHRNDKVLPNATPWETNERHQQFENDHHPTALTTNYKAFETTATAILKNATNNSNTTANTTTTTTDRINQLDKVPNEKYDSNDDSHDLKRSQATTPTKANKFCCAFTIDPFNDKDNDPAAAAAKYKNMLERFQNRHRRGASLSKVETTETTTERSSSAAAAEARASPPPPSSSSTTSTAAATTNNNADCKKSNTITHSTSTTFTRSTRQNANRNSCEIVVENEGSGDNNNVGGVGVGVGVGTNSTVVKLRARDRSTSRVRDASKRHSWSPRSSTSEVQQQNRQHPHPQQHSNNTSSSNNTPTTAQNRKTPTAATPKAITSRSATTTTGKTKPLPLQMPRGAANLVANRTQFTPRSTAMQMALQAVDLICPQPPLADFAQLTADAADNLSEAGTYTLDGDNYTEEQKEVMNIDKNARQLAHKQQQLQQQQKLRPKVLHLCKETDGILNSVRHNIDERKFPGISKRGNVLEVNYYHENEAADEMPLHAADLILAGQKQKQQHQQQHHPDAYLQNLRSHIASKISTANSNEAESTPERMTTTGGCGADDVGFFTSVTKSGVLAKQSALDPCPNLMRRGSLSTSQIDSSEYVSKDAKTKNLTANVYPGGSFTDHQKSEYCLNVFQKDGNKRLAATRGMIESPPQTPISTKMRPPSKLADTAALKTAQTKEEWIKVWARNARAHSIANDTRVSGGTKNRPHGADELMTRSYTCSDTGAESLTDDTIYNNQLKKTLNARHRMLNTTAPGTADCDYSSDPSLTSTYARSQHDVNTGTAYKPPKSPTKIPSPMHSIGRARSTSRVRPQLQNILSPDGADADGDADSHSNSHSHDYRETRNNASRKNSVKSPEHATTTSANGLRAQALYASSMLSPEDRSPQHSIEGSPATYRRSPSQQQQLHQQQQQQPHQQQQQQHHHQHRRILSNDATYGMPMHRDLMTSSINEQQLQLLTSGEYVNKLGRPRKNSYDGGNINSNSPGRRVTKTKPTASPYEQQRAQQRIAEQENASMSPLRRSTSFSTKNAVNNQSSAGYHQRAARPQFQNVYTPPALRQQYAHENNSATRMSSGNSIIKSASSNSFRQMYDYSDYDDRQQYYINDQDELIEDLLYVEDDYTSADEEEEVEDEEYEMERLETPAQANPILPHTRINKALLMRMEMNKQKFGGKPNSAPAKTTANVNANAAVTATTIAGGVIACPNTPELPRRNIRSAPRASLGSGNGSGNTRTSMPRDSSLSRLVNRVPTSLASAKKQLLQTAANGMPPTTPRTNSGNSQLQKVQPKYLDISKYKSAQSQDFLRRQDPRTTLKIPLEAKKGNATGIAGAGAGAGGGGGGGSGSGGLTRADATRASARSTKSMSVGMSTSASGSLSGGNSTYNSSGNPGAGGSYHGKRDWIVNKTKDVELALWKKRATYDPMKAANEDRRRKEEARRLEKAKKNTNMEAATTAAPSGATTTSERQSRAYYRRGYC